MPDTSMDVVNDVATVDFDLVFAGYDAEIGDDQNESESVLLSTNAQFTTVVREYCYSVGWEASQASELPEVLHTFAAWFIAKVKAGDCDDIINFVSSSVFSYDDVKYVVLKEAQIWLGRQDWKSKEYRAENSRKYFDMLASIPAPVSKARSFCLNMNKVSEALVHQLRYKKMKQLYSNVWIEFCKFKHSDPILRLMLAHIAEEVLPNLEDATLLTDFFVRAFQMPQPTNIVALHGLFILIAHHNLDYPNFYSNVYALLTPAIFYCNEKKEFFRILDLLMSSSHLPAYVLAAFVKRLSRLCLVAPLDCLSPILASIHNWIIRHPSLQTMVQKENPENMLEDPFVESESDPQKARAMQSSLWELKTLQSHYHHSVSRGSMWVENVLPPIEKPVNWKTDKELWSKDLKRPMVSMTNPQVPTNFLPPGRLFSSKHFQFDEYFEF